MKDKEGQQHGRLNYLDLILTDIDEKAMLAIFEEFENKGRLLHRPASKKVVKETLNEFTLPGNILEVGSGIGELSRPVGNYANRLIQSDTNPVYVRKNKERNPASNLVIADMYHLPFADMTFNTVVGYSTLDALSNLPVGLREIRRVIRSNGRLYIFLSRLIVVCISIDGILGDL